MNFYKRHLGDLTSACSHLSQGEMGAYDLLMDWCYANERPLPLRRADIHRIGRASTKAERMNVDRVLGEFFEETENGYTQKRVLEEIARYSSQRDINREIGRRGGRPKATHKITDSVSDSDSRSVTESAAKSATESDGKSEPNRNPSQNPESTTTPFGSCASERSRGGAEVCTGPPFGRRPAAKAVEQAPSSKERVVPLQNQRVADEFRDMEYAGTPIEQLPSELKFAAQRAIAGD